VRRDPEIIATKERKIPVSIFKDRSPK